MKSLRRYCSVLLCCVLLLGAFSVSASAEEVDNSYIVTVASRIYSDWSTSDKGSITFSPNDGESLQGLGTVTLSNELITSYPNWHLETKYIIAFEDGSILSKKGSRTTFSLNNAYYSYLAHYYGEGPQYQYIDTFDKLRVCVVYVDGSTEYIEDVVAEHVSGTRNINLSVTLEPSKDVQKIEFHVASRYSELWTSTTGSVEITMYQGEWNGDGKYQYLVEVQSEEAGLLSGILGWIENIWNTVTDGFTDMKNGITNIVNTIIELPAKIWSYIETGIKNLFVPDEEYLASYKDKWNELLEDKLGAIYQAVYLVTESWEHIQMADEQNTIYIPEVTIELPSDTTFTFGGYDVVIVPHKFEWLATSFKTVSAILATWMFIESLRRRYLEVLGTGGVNTW